jgi:hypothetical protein
MSAMTGSVRFLPVLDGLDVAAGRRPLFFFLFVVFFCA